MLELNLLDRLESEDLCELRKFFFPENLQSKEVTQRKQPRHKKKAEYKQAKEQKYGGQPLRKKQFIKAIEKVVGKLLQIKPINPINIYINKSHQ